MIDGEPSGHPFVSGNLSYVTVGRRFRCKCSAAYPYRDILTIAFSHTILPAIAQRPPLGGDRDLRQIRMRFDLECLTTGLVNHQRSGEPIEQFRILLDLFERQRTEIDFIGERVDILAEPCVRKHADYQDRLSCVQEDCAGAVERKDRRIYTGPAVLHRLGSVPRR